MASRNGMDRAVRPLRLRLLLVVEPGSSTRRTAERYLDQVGPNLTGTWKLDSNAAIKRAVREGLDD